MFYPAIIGEIPPVLYFDDIPCQRFRAILPSIKPNRVRVNLPPRCKMTISFNPPRPSAIAFPAFRLFACLMTAIVLTFFITGCGKKGVPADSASSLTNRDNTAPGPAPTPAEPVAIQPAENGDGAYRVMRAAIKDAKLSPDDIGYVNAHGTSTPIGDVIETRALKRVFGERAKQVPVSSTKSMTGHLLGGAGGLEAGISVLALRDQILPPTINQETPDPECDLDYVPNHARKASVEYALSNSFGFGGTNAALIFKRWSGK